MGLLDWLTDSIGDSGSAMADNPGGMSSAGTPPVPPSDSGNAPPIAPVDPSTQPIGGAGPSGGSAAPDTPPPPVPMPQPRPAAANGLPPTPPNAGGPPPAPAAAPMPLTPPTPPPGGAAPGGAMPPGSIPPPPPMGSPNGNPQAQGFLGRALGLDPNAEARLRGSLGAGLKAAGNSAGKSPMQALAGGAGAGIEGGKTAADKTADDQNKFLTQQTNANNSKSLTQLRQAQSEQALAAAKDKMTGGKSSVMNSQQQLYLRAMGLVNNDPEVKLAKSTYDSALKETGDPNSDQAKAAQKAHADLVQAKVQAHLGALGLDPALATKLAKMPGSTMDNPVPKEGLTQPKFDQLPAGAYFVNPKDNRVLIKKAPQPQQPQAGGGAGGSPPQPQTDPAAGDPAAGTPPTPPIPPTGKRADANDDDESEGA